jgi:hypothetical protein
MSVAVQHTPSQTFLGDIPVLGIGVLVAMIRPSMNRAILKDARRQRRCRAASVTTVARVGVVVFVQGLLVRRPPVSEITCQAPRKARISGIGGRDRPATSAPVGSNALPGGFPHRRQVLEEMQQLPVMVPQQAKLPSRARSARSLFFFWESGIVTRSHKTHRVTVTA